jgi:hypothetical protein
MGWKVWARGPNSTSSSPPPAGAAESGTYVSTLSPGLDYILMCYYIAYVNSGKSVASWSWISWLPCVCGGVPRPATPPGPPSPATSCIIYLALSLVSPLRPTPLRPTLLLAPSLMVLEMAPEFRASFAPVLWWFFGVSLFVWISSGFS